MGFTITTEDDERLWHAYREQRDALRNVMGYGVYPNLVKAIETLTAFETALAGPLADEDLIAYHESLMAPIAPYMAQIQQLAAGMVAIMQAIETASPGTFGITLPVAPPEEPPAQALQEKPE